MTIQMMDQKKLQNTEDRNENIKYIKSNENKGQRKCIKQLLRLLSHQICCNSRCRFRVFSSIEQMEMFKKLKY